MDFKTFKVGELFDVIKQGRRLKKDDRLAGNIPFITAGGFNQGVSDYVDNPIACYEGNSLTIDMFGNVFVHQGMYGFDDNIVVYAFNDNVSIDVYLYLATVIQKVVNSRFSYGKQFRASANLDLELTLPVTPDGTPDWDAMAKLQTIFTKLAIQDLRADLDTKLAELQAL